MLVTPNYYGASLVWLPLQRPYQFYMLLLANQCKLWLTRYLVKSLPWHLDKLCHLKWSALAMVGWFLTCIVLWYHFGDTYSMLILMQGIYHSCMDFFHIVCIILYLIGIGCVLCYLRVDCWGWLCPLFMVPIRLKIVSFFKTNCCSWMAFLCLVTFLFLQHYFCIQLQLFQHWRSCIISLCMLT